MRDSSRQSKGLLAESGRERFRRMNRFSFLFQAKTVIAEDAFDGLIVLGGFVPDILRRDPQVVDLVCSFGRSARLLPRLRPLQEKKFERQTFAAGRIEESFSLERQTALPGGGFGLGKVGAVVDAAGFVAL
jgi:hypothetical protein